MYMILIRCRGWEEGRVGSADPFVGLQFVQLSERHFVYK